MRSDWMITSVGDDALHTIPFRMTIIRRVAEIRHGKDVPLTRASSRKVSRTFAAASHRVLRISHKAMTTSMATVAS